MTITEFLLARIAEDEAVARANMASGPFGTSYRRGVGGSLLVPPARVLAESEAKRKIVEFHKSWPVLVTTPPTFELVGPSDVNTMSMRASQQIAWATEQEYRTKFGIEPPTAPMLRALALVYADHPDFDEAWR